MTKKLIILFAVVAIAATSATAFALTGTKGRADRIALRDGYSQYEGKIDLRDSTGTVIYYYWGGGRCAGMTAPTERQIDILLQAHVHDREVSLDYDNNTVSPYGTSRCWDGGIQVW